MTEAPAEAVPEAPDGPPVVVRRQGRRRREQRRLLAVQVVVTLLCVALLAGLGLLGYRNVLKITGGTSTEKVTDPSLPGYTAEVRPTPVDLVAFTAPDGRLAALTMFVGGPGGKGGTVIPVPSTLTLWEYEGAPPAAAFEVFADGGIDALRVRLGAELTFGLTGTATVPTSALRVLAESAGPVTIDLGDDVREGTTDQNQKIRYPAGSLTLDAAGVEEFLSFSGYREPEGNRVLRSQLVWEQLLDRLRTSGDGTVPDLGASAGQGEPSFADVLSTVLRGKVGVEALPLERIPLKNAQKVVLYRVDTRAMPKWVPEVVPFPSSAFPGQRAAVRLLRGTPRPEDLQAVSSKVVEGGGEITTVGNASSFDVATSAVRFEQPDARPAAARIARLLGLTVSRATAPLGGVDVEVVVGKDLGR